MRDLGELVEKEILPEGVARRICLPVYGPTTSSGRLVIDYGPEGKIAGVSWEGELMRTYQTRYMQASANYMGKCVPLC